MYEELLLCQCSRIYDLARSCEDTMSPNPFIIECKEARRLCSQALSNMYTMNSFNNSLISLVSHLKQKKIFKPLCLSCTSEPLSTAPKSTPGYLGMFCASCSLALVDSTEAHVAYSRFLSLFERLFEKRNEKQALNTIRNMQQLSFRTLDMIYRLPTTATEIPRPQ